MHEDIVCIEYSHLPIHEHLSHESSQSRIYIKKLEQKDGK